MLNHTMLQFFSKSCFDDNCFKPMLNHTMLQLTKRKGEE